MRDKAREVFAALTANTDGSGGGESTLLENFEDVFDNAFASWRVFFRSLKDLTADPESALAELANGGFLAGSELARVTRACVTGCPEAGGADAFLTPSSPAQLLGGSTGTHPSFTSWTSSTSHTSPLVTSPASSYLRSYI